MEVEKVAFDVTAVLDSDMGVLRGGSGDRIWDILMIKITLQCELLFL